MMQQKTKIRKAGDKYIIADDYSRIILEQTDKGVMLSEISAIPKPKKHISPCNSV